MNLFTRTAHPYTRAVIGHCCKHPVPLYAHPQYPRNTLHDRRIYMRMVVILCRNAKVPTENSYCYDTGEWQRHIRTLLLTVIYSQRLN